MKEYGKRGIALLGTMLMIGICMRGSMGRLTALAARMPHGIILAGDGHKESCSFHDRGWQFIRGR